MMLKFRAWDVHNKEMFANDQLIIWDGNIYANDPGKISVDKMRGWSIDEKYLMQSTGLFDKNGKEIFEDDVVKLIDEYGGSGMSKVISQEGSLGMVIEEVFVPFATISILSTVDYTLEVIGNIYENPELVEEINE